MHNKYTWRTGILEVVMIVVAILFVIPLYLLVNVALRTSNDPASVLALPTQITFDNFARAWVDGNLGNALVNSGIVAVVSTVLIILFSAFAAYPLARSMRRLSKFAYYGFLAGLLLPFQLALIPLYLTMRDIGLLGTVWSLVLFYVGSQMPFSIFLYAGFLRRVPIEYEEAASVDGAGPVGTFWRVVFPLLRPITGTVAILNLINIWNDFFTPLLYLSGSGQQTVPVALYSFFGQYSTEWNIVFAGLLISVAPVLLLYFLLQRTVIQGFASGLKG
ncbi:carbohydrate ABC transporter permease [Herbiconiux ginsengi]|uniref:Carbohydrate ABC transporter membrane protein 2, CUT1 family n=1 Tax=Herbiconiux ginsengi TaxID=381665 RepID=A0A1H3LKK1_9MICO|nr:carbohydrate ABC transporter permease [Herbiconiux ginsengi]SDY64972.1 carbohydrate ABC transporter membrane protein 2, CUT1 family [Herbiconiux ginsengi]